ncbi:hypothetical protein TIFTF001_049668 [Ficus carica]|uniref:Uncharacterized protein n=1 Tax=Ficus carica TaxID=3494 RepID=A0AA87ZG94_FICCA|nr:hypothetical protein TIFTF001_049668 [Ficus carica]
MSISLSSAAIGSEGPSNTGAFIRLNHSYNKSSRTSGGFTCIPAGANGTSAFRGISGCTSGIRGTTGGT